MELDEKRRWLRRYRMEQWKLKRIQCDLNELIDAATRITPSLEGMPHGTDVGDKVGNAAQAITDKRQELCAQITKCNEVRAEIMEAISTLESERIQAIFVMKFITGMSDEKIADELDIDSRYIRRLIHNGLYNLSF